MADQGDRHATLGDAMLPVTLRVTAAADPEAGAAAAIGRPGIDVARLPFEIRIPLTPELQEALMRAGWRP